MKQQQPEMLSLIHNDRN